MPIFPNNRHGVFCPGLPHNRIVTTSSRKNPNLQPTIKLDKLFKAEKPVICIKRRLGGIGDVLMTTPLLRALKKLIPHCKLIYATDLKYSEGALGDIILHNPYVDELIPLNQIKESEYDYSVDITSTGLSKERSMHTPPNRIDMFAEAAGLSVDDDPVPIYEVTEGERELAKEYISELLGGRDRELLKVIAIQARSNDVRRTWPAKSVQELANLLAEREDTIVLLCDWGSSVPTWSSSKENLILFNDKTFVETAAIIEQVDLVICPDSSMLHLAGALNKKIVTIFGPIPPQSRINHYPNATAVLHKVSCQYCVVGESKVLTDTGYKEIQTINKDDLVLSSCGNYNKVIEVFKNERKDRKLIELSVFGSNEPLIVTEEHKILSSKRSFHYEKGKIVLDFSAPEFIEAKDLKEKDYCCIPIPKEKENNNPLLKRKDLSWLLGLFVAEGWTVTPRNSSREYLVKFAINEKEIDIEKRIREIVASNKDIFCSNKSNSGFISSRPNPKGKSTIVTICNKNLTKLINSTFGKTLNERVSLKNKFIPKELITSSENIINAFVSGLLKGDGYDDICHNVLSTSKQNIAFGTQLLFARLGIVAKVYKRNRDTNFKKNTTIYRVYATKQVRWKRWRKIDNNFLVPIKKIKYSDRRDEFVYDISVENNPTFTINNLSVFDCWYTPRCHKDNNHSYLECLTGITPQQVYDTAMKKIDEPLSMGKIVAFGKDKSVGNQDPIILVRRNSTGFGDLLMAMNSLEALKKKHPTKEIHVAVPDELIPALKNNPNVDMVLSINEPINYRRYFLVADITAPCSRYESTRVRANRPVEKNRVEIYAEALGVRDLITDLRPRYYLSEEEKLEASSFLADKIDINKKTIGIVLESAELYRSWPEVQIRELVSMLKNSYNVVLITKRKTDIQGIVSTFGNSLRQMAAIVSQCDLLVTPDTGVLHLGAALEIPTVAIFGPIDYKARCKGYKNVTVIKSDMPCSPCWRNGVTKCKKTQEINAYSECIKSIPVKNVYDIVVSKTKEIPKCVN